MNEIASDNKRVSRPRPISEGGSSYKHVVAKKTTKNSGKQQKSTKPKNQTGKQKNSKNKNKSKKKK